MRVSTGLLFDSGTASMLRNQSELYRIQNQISTGRRVLAPSDDPVSSAQAALTEQAKSVNAQFAENQGEAKSALAMVEGHLSSLTDLIQNVRERVVQLGNASLSTGDKASVAAELEQRFAELMGIASSQNGLGQYMFSGFQGNVSPFSIVSPVGAAPFSAGTPVTAPDNPYVAYSGDDGERILQVDASRQMSISVSGADVFMRIKQGNGTFATAVDGSNVGSGRIDQGSVLDLAKWNSATAAFQPQDFRIDFQLDSSTVPGVLKYNLIDVASGSSLFTNAAPGAVTDPDWKVYTPGQAIPFTGLADPAVVPGGNLGIQVTVVGTPASGDSFSVHSSQNQSIFDTFQNLIAAAREPVAAGLGGNTILSNRVGEGIANLDQALENVLRVRASVGSRLAELDSLTTASADKSVQYDQRLSELQELDYTSAISELNRRQIQLEAAQKSFTRVTSLSLFNLL